MVNIGLPLPRVAMQNCSNTLRCGRLLYTRSAPPFLVLQQLRPLSCVSGKRVSEYYCRDSYFLTVSSASGVAICPNALAA